MTPERLHFETNDSQPEYGRPEGVARYKMGLKKQRKNLEHQKTTEKNTNEKNPKAEKNNKLPEQPSILE